MKICSCCRVSKDDSEFNRRANRKDGLQSFCRLCSNKAVSSWSRTAEGQIKSKIRMRKYLASPKGKAFLQARDRRYLATPNGRASKQRCRARYLKLHPEVMRNANRRYRLRNPEKEAVRLARYAKSHPEVICAIAARRRARKLAQCPESVNQSVLAKIYAQAAFLKAFGFNVEVDHKIPLAGGGLHSPDNLRIISAEDNRRKGAKLDYPECYEFPLEGLPVPATL